MTSNMNATGMVDTMEASDTTGKDQRYIENNMGGTTLGYSLETSVQGYQKVNTGGL